MEVKADLRPILGPTLVRLDPSRVKQLQNMTVYKALDALSQLSADSMQLRQPLTTCEKLINSEHTLYLSWEYDEEKKVSRFIGLLKVGRKKLFLYDNEMHTYEGRILCLLDFYVHYSVQRQGHGRKLFDFMLTNEHVQPFEVALDNPSVTLLGFVGRQYYLYNPIWQNTNFVVFPELFAALGPDEEFAREAPEGWRRPETPRRIGTGMTQTRYIAQAVSGHPSRGNATCSPVDADQSTEGTLANRAHQARVRKAHILSSKPLW